MDDGEGGIENAIDRWCRIILDVKVRTSDYRSFVMAR